jgi:ADP-heptose:LPS heptosyltransferase
MFAGPAPESHVVIIRLSSFGDVVLTEPVARTLRERHPAGTLWFVTNSPYSGIPEMFASVDKVIAYSRQGDNRELAEIGNEVVFDLVLDLQNNRRSHGITRMLRARRILRHRKQRFQRLLSVYIPWIWKGRLRHTVESYFDVVAPLGWEAGDLTPVVRPPERSIEQAANCLGEGSFVGICPGGSSEHKRWSSEHFVELISILRSRGQRIALIGSEEDRSPVESILQMAGRDDARAYIGTDVGLIAGLLSLCPVTITNDSGLMHLAAAVGSRVIAIFGPTSPVLGFGPTAQGSVIVTRGLTCSPCSFHGNRPCRYGTRECLEAINPADIADIVTDLCTTSLIQ